jgi:hypothetical protein
MAAKEGIIAAIQAKVDSSYNTYRIGLTHELAERKAYWKDTEKQTVTSWSAWIANSLSDAQDIESHFINKGMLGGAGETLSADKTLYVYVF